MEEYPAPKPIGSGGKVTGLFGSGFWYEVSLEVLCVFHKCQEHLALSRAVWVSAMTSRQCVTVSAGTAELMHGVGAELQVLKPAVGFSPAAPKVKS